MKNKLSDLNNHLFAQLERLNDENLEGEKLEDEIKRSKAVGSIAKGIISNGKLLLESKKYFDEMGLKSEQQPEILKIESGKVNERDKSK